MAKKPKIQTRKPPPTAALEQFVAGGAGSALGPHGGKKTRRTIMTGDRAGQVEARVTVCLPDHLLQRAKVWCVTNRTTLSAVFEAALRERMGD
jgi:hypothetical protein